MKRIFLLRHAKSSWDEPGAEDFQRPLSQRGEKAVEVMARQLAKLVIKPDLVLCSPARRTRQTYEGLARALRDIPVEYPEEIYEAGADALLRVLRGVDDGHERVMMIGHNPGLGALAQILVSGQGSVKALSRLNEKFPTGALASLETNVAHWEELGEGSCRLVAFLRPTDVKE